MKDLNKLKLQHWTDHDGAHMQVNEYLSPVGESEPIADVWAGKELAEEMARRWNTQPDLLAALIRAEQALADIINAADNGHPYSPIELNENFLSDNDAARVAIEKATNP